MPNQTNVNLTDVNYLWHPFLAPNSYSQGTREGLDITAHEFMETITDPNGDGWTTTDGFEVADLCSGLYQNWVPIGAGRWQIQQIWSNKINSCSQGGGAAVSLLGATSSSSTVSDFTIPGATYGVFGLGINNSGVIAGTYYNTNSGTVLSGFLRTAQGTVSAINVPGAATTVVWALNDSGSSAGFYSASGTEFAGRSAHAFVRNSSGVITSFDPTTNSTFPGVTGINTSGAVIGTYIDESGLTHAFVRDPSGNVTTFDAPGHPDQTIPLSINDGGWITGFFDFLNHPFHGFVRDSGGNITTFDVPGGVNGTQPMAINANGAIVGTYTDANFVRHAFMRDPSGTISTFDAPNAKYATVAQSINKFGEISGYFSDANAVSYGFLRDVNGNFRILNAIPYSINNSGATAGYAAVPLKK